MNRLIITRISWMIVVTFFATPIFAQTLTISGGNDYSLMICQDGTILTWGE